MTLSPPPTHHPHLLAYLASLRAAGKASTARTTEGYLRQFSRWLITEGLTADRVTTSDLQRFQAALHAHRTAAGQPLASATIATMTAMLRSAYAWMHQTGLILIDPAAGLSLPKQAHRAGVTAEHLSQQESIALLATLNRPHELRLHLRGALTNGVSRREIAAVLIHCGVYCGAPVAVDSFRIAREVFAELDQPGA